MTDNREQQEFMTMDDVAARYRISKSTLYMMVSKRELPSLKIGRRVLFRKADLDAYVQSKLRTKDNQNDWFTIYYHTIHAIISFAYINFETAPF